MASTREKLRSGSTLPIPAVGSAPPTPTPTEEEYGDLIKFYNQVFVSKMEEVAKKLSSSTENGAEKEVRTVRCLSSKIIFVLSERHAFVADASFEVAVVVSSPSYRGRRVRFSNEGRIHATVSIPSTALQL